MGAVAKAPIRLKGDRTSGFILRDFLRLVVLAQVALLQLLPERLDTFLRLNLRSSWKSFLCFSAVRGENRVASIIIVHFAQNGKPLTIFLRCIRGGFFILAKERFSLYSCTFWVLSSFLLQSIRVGILKVKGLDFLNGVVTRLLLDLKIIFIWDHSVKLQIELFTERTYADADSLRIRSRRVLFREKFLLKVWIYVDFLRELGSANCSFLKETLRSQVGFVWF